MKRHSHCYLITGAAGFVGSHLSAYLLARGDRVVGIDNLSTGARRNLERQLDHPHFNLIVQDICDPLNVCCDAIYHLASPASPIHYQADAMQTLRTNTVGTLNVLELARRLNVPVFLASTSEVYGDPDVHPQNERYWGNVNPTGPRACYDEGKRCAEAMFFSAHRQYGVPIRVARFFNTYGPNMDPQDGRVVSNFIMQAISGEPITLYGDGSQTRSFCYVSDLVEGIVRLMDHHENCVGPVNLGNPHEITVQQLAETVRKLTGSDVPLCYRPLPQDDPKRRKPDISLATELLHWKPTVPLEEGVQQTIAYFEALARITQE